MKQLAYSSTVAFLAYYLALSTAASESGGAFPVSSQDRATLDAMHQLMEGLTPEERTVLLGEAAGSAAKCSSSADRRRRQRAHLKLHRLLVAREILSG